ncbi:geranylgeranyl diphosphate synthase, type II [Ruminococcaceae bacterium YAD3003]|nr:geranylgeranyl diphosphate synthase, type II [Ruminococcaceae bacterium YAD3003]
MSKSDINSLMEKTEAWITPELERVFDSDLNDDITVKAASYSLFAGGKRLRPMMMRLTSQMLGIGDEIDSDVKYFAATLEMIHTYSLIHDDLPAMDNDEMRRGKPTCHMVYGEGIATLAGDLLLNSAMERLFLISEKNPGYIYAASAMAANAGIYGMIGGQSIDISSTEKEIPIERLIELQEKKTGALIEASVVTPYYLFKKLTREESTVDKTAIELRKLASHIGLAFQIRDDILDVISDSSVLGKSTGKDERDSKATFVTLLSLEGAESRLSEEINCAKSILSNFKDKGYNTTDYETLIDYLENRNK